MDDRTLTKLIVLGIVIVVFVVTLLLMPRIFGATRPPKTPKEPDDPERPRRSGEP